MAHIPVLPEEIVKLLDLKPDDIVFDGTVGNGGHAKEILPLIPKGKYIANDADPIALQATRENLGKYSDQLIFSHDNFSRISHIIEGSRINRVNKILLDVGLRSDQLDMPGRGFSFKHLNDPLDMRFGEKDIEVTAGEIVNEWSEESIADILYGFSGERYAKKIAREIVERREEQEIGTVSDLVETITSVKGRRGKIHPATKAFQALRIAVNQELDQLEKVIFEGWKVLAPEGRLAIISFHSLEDRIVKRSFKEIVKIVRQSESGEEMANILTKRPISPTRDEVIRNPRSRSAKLRAIEKLQEKN